jgi:hypothetical protein
MANRPAGQAFITITILDLQEHLEDENERHYA